MSPHGTPAFPGRYQGRAGGDRYRDSRLTMDRYRPAVAHQRRRGLEVAKIAAHRGAKSAGRGAHRPAHRGGRPLHADMAGQRTRVELARAGRCTPSGGTDQDHLEVVSPSG